MQTSQQHLQEIETLIKSYEDQSLKQQQINELVSKQSWHKSLCCTLYSSPTRSPLSPSITHSLFHSRLKSRLFHKSFPPQSASIHPDCFLGLYWTGLTVLDSFFFIFGYFSLLHCALSLAVQCIVIGPVCVFATGGRCGSVTTITKNKIACNDPHQTGFVGKG